jgi:Domain of unknown function (DUF4920)
MRLVLISLLLATPALAETQRFGKPLEGRAPDNLEAVLKAPADGQAVRLEGRIEAVCRNKGCWLELKQGAASVHVTFEGYSFFVPKDSAGREAVLEGRLKVEKPKPEELEHLQGEGAKKAGAGVSVVAAGVEIR